MSRPPFSRDRVRGCLLGGALGDALGAPVEFLSPAAIRRGSGPEGLTDWGPAHGQVRAITDATQMGLFTAEGLVLAARVGAGPGEALRIVHRAYLRWLRTQGGISRHASFEGTREGWLLDVPALRSRGAPERTCLAALRGARMGRIEQPPNASRGCGGVARVAAVGLASWVDDPFRMGCQVAALTHGHPSGYLPAGFVALTVRELAGEATLERACQEALEELRRWPGSSESASVIEGALRRAGEGRASGETVESLGRGRDAAEAVAIAVFCARVASDFESALRLAVNHGGDSDATGTITGQLAGAWRGAASIPGRWLERVELRDEIERVAGCLLSPGRDRSHPGRDRELRGP